jgi:hypothetical protein
MHIFEVFYPDLFKVTGSVQFEYHDLDAHSEYGFGSGHADPDSNQQPDLVTWRKIVCYFDVGDEIWQRLS